MFAGTASAAVAAELLPGVSMTTMTWKQAVFFGGAVLILAACDSATAPTPPQSSLKVEKGAASVKTQTPPSTPAPTADDCRSGYSVQVGFTGTDVSASACLLQ
jgi:hypothetical protein